MTVWPSKPVVDRMIQYDAGLWVSKQCRPTFGQLFKFYQICIMRYWLIYPWKGISASGWIIPAQSYLSIFFYQKQMILENELITSYVVRGGKSPSVSTMSQGASQLSLNSWHTETPSDFFTAFNYVVHDADHAVVSLTQLRKSEEQQISGQLLQTPTAVNSDA